MRASVVLSLLLLAPVVVVPRTVHAGAVDAAMLCGVFKQTEVDYVVPTPDGRKLTQPIACAIQIQKAPKGSLSASVWVKTGERESPRLSKPIAKGDDFAVELSPTRDFSPCTNFEIIARIVGPDGVLWQDTKSVTQTCTPAATRPSVAAKPIAAAKPATSPPAANDGAQWAEGSLAQIPEAAQGLAKQFIDAVVDSDPPALGSLAGAGIKRGKKTLVAKDVYDLTPYGIKPQKGCDEQGNHCKYGPWQVITKGPTEFWIYSDNDSGYGAFGAAVFSLRKGAWAWTGLRTYDTGEP